MTTIIILAVVGIIIIGVMYAVTASRDKNTSGSGSDSSNRNRSDGDTTREP